MKNRNKLNKILKLILCLFIAWSLLTWYNEEFYQISYILVYHKFFNNYHYIFNKYKREELNISFIKSLRSECECRHSDRIEIKENIEDNSYRVNLKGSRMIDYKIGIEELKSAVFTCDLFKSLRRGPNSKVFSFSLYGRNRFYYDLIKDIAYLVKKLFPDWIIRINHDSSIDKSIICEMECLNYDNIDFCNVEKLPYDLSGYSKEWNASHMHGMTWRWLLIGDSFVDYFNSRDTDSSISQREVDAVHYWIYESEKLFHVMRDHPQHGMPIVG
jgi:hypothetical protein